MIPSRSKRYPDDSSTGVSPILIIASRTMVTPFVVSNTPLYVGTHGKFASIKRRPRHAEFQRAALLKRNNLPEGCHCVAFFLGSVRKLRERQKAALCGFNYIEYQDCNCIHMARLLVASRPDRCCARGRATRPNTIPSRRYSANCSAGKIGPSTHVRR